MRVLGIESSCDETAAAVVDETGRVHSDVVASQIDVHSMYGGVVPELASRAHLRAVVPVVDEAVRTAGGWSRVDRIAVTQGPGLVGALLVGAQFARALAWARQLPLVGVDHLQGHLLACHLRYADDDDARSPEYPYVALLVSGGHTALYRVDDPTTSELLGQTRDDAAGEAFDKAAKLLELGYPGGPLVDRLAARGDATRYALPRPMLHRRTRKRAAENAAAAQPRSDRADLDFSFSGLKTALARIVEKEGLPATETHRADVCASLQAAIVEVLAHKAVAACQQEGIDRLVLGGGVAANSGLRARAAQLCEAKGIALFIPPVRACTDNAAMIAYTGLHGDVNAPIVPYSRAKGRRRGKFRQDGSHIAR